MGNLKAQKGRAWPPPAQPGGAPHRPRICKDNPLPGPLPPGLPAPQPRLCSRAGFTEPPLCNPSKPAGSPTMPPLGPPQQGGHTERGGGPLRRSRIGGEPLSVPQLPHRLRRLSSKAVSEQPRTTGEELGDPPRTWIPPHAREVRCRGRKGQPGVLILGPLPPMSQGRRTVLMAGAHGEGCPCFPPSQHRARPCAQPPSGALARQGPSQHTRGCPREEVPFPEED